MNYCHICGRHEKPHWNPAAEPDWDTLAAIADNTDDIIHLITHLWDAWHRAHPKLRNYFTAPLLRRIALIA